MFKKLVYAEPDASKTCAWTNGNASEIIGFVDERGVPYITSFQGQKPSNFKEIIGKMNNLQINNTIRQPTSSSSKSDTRNSVQVKTPITSSDDSIRHPTVSFPKFIFTIDQCAIEITENGIVRKVKNTFG